MTKPRKVDASYAAGLLDSDGSMSIILRRRSDKAPWHELVVALQQCRPEAVDWLKKTFGGSVSPWYKKGIKQHKWSLCTRQATRFLEIVQPFVLVKAKAVQIALEFAATIGPRGRNGLPPRMFNKREILRARLQNENARRIRAA